MVSVESIEAWAIPETPALRVLISRAQAPEPTEAVSREWARLCARNPRLFDGPVLSVLNFDQESNVIHCRRDGYRRLCVQPAVATGVRLLSVTGVLFTNYGMMLGSGPTGMNVFWNSPFWMGPVPVEDRAPTPRATKTQAAPRSNERLPP